MPNTRIYSNLIKDFEKNASSSIIDANKVAKKLKDAWKNDKTEAKLDYLSTYREIFSEVLKKYADNEIYVSLFNLKEEMPSLRDCLLKTDETLKFCALSLIPELREKEDVLSHMTFGVIEPTNLKNEFLWVKSTYLNTRNSDKLMEKRKNDAYERYKVGWQKTLTRNITAVVYDKDAIELMSKSDKIDFALALETYRNDTNKKPAFDSNEKALIDDALVAWKGEIGCDKDLSINEFVAGEIFNSSKKIGENNWIENQVNDAIFEYNKEPNPAKKEIENFKKVEEENAKLQKSQDTIEADQMAEALGDFFMQEELIQDLGENSDIKERLLLEEKVDNFNKTYSLKLNHHKLRTSVEQLSTLMIKAQEEKRLFLDENSVVVIENGKETCYTAKDYFKDKILEANQTCVDKINKIEDERKRAEDERKNYFKKLDLQDNIGDKEVIEELKNEYEKKFKEKMLGFDNSLKDARTNLSETLSSLKGGIVIEQNGDKQKQYKSSRYYETHETKKEQEAYGEYQKMYSHMYREACKSLKEQNYVEGKITDFSHVAKSVDEICKAALYISNVYDNEKNNEIIQKCSFGGLSAEQLASFATSIEDDDWAKAQYNDNVWQKQSDKARKIFTQFNKNLENNKKLKPGDMLKDVLDNNRKTFEKGGMTRKQLLDYMVASEALLERLYPTGFSKFLNMIQYNRARNALTRGRVALGIKTETPIRMAMNEEYVRMGKMMSKEQVFKSIEQRMDYSIGANAEKMSFEKEHKDLKEREKARKISELEALKAKDREPITIPNLDERKAIVNASPKVPPIQANVITNPNLNINK